MSLRRFMPFAAGQSWDFVAPSSGLLLDLNANKIPDNDGSVFTLWNDSSGNGNNVSNPGTPTSRIYKTLINGRPGVDLAGAGFTTPPITIGVRTYYIVLKMAKDDDPLGSVIYQDTNPYCQLYFPSNGDINTYVNGTAQTSGFKWVLNVPLIVKAEIKSTTSQISINGVAGPVNTHAAISPINYLFKIGYAGAATPLHLGRVLLYNGSLSPANDTIVLNGLAKQFNIAI